MAGSGGVPGLLQAASLAMACRQDDPLGSRRLLFLGHAALGLTV